MRIIFHIGMGKTGTTTIQRTLQASSDCLAAQKASYLGMWFGALGPEFRNYAGLGQLVRTDAAQQAILAGTFARHATAVAKRTDADLVIHSNESIFEQPSQLAPFFRTLREKVDLRFVCYLRAPQDWLPSAYIQWHIRHKTQAGPIERFSVRAPALLRMYDAIRIWRDLFLDILDVRLYTPSIDVITDFGDALGITLPTSAVRHMERSEPAELVLRGLLNDRFTEAVMPDLFERAVLSGARLPPYSIDRMIDVCFDNGNIDAMIEGNRPTFEYIRDELGYDFLTGSSNNSVTIDRKHTHNRLIDYLIEMTLSQALKIQILERQVGELMKPE